MFKSLDPLLKTFLLERGLLLSFHANMLLSAKSISDYVDLKNLLAEADTFSIIKAFDWNKTIEGEDYWYAINRKWEIYFSFISQN